MRLPTLPAPARYPLQVFGLMLILNQLFRFIFFTYNRAGGGDFVFWDTLWAFVIGFRFDTAAILLCAGIPLFFLSLPTGMLRRWATYRVLNLILGCINLLLILVNAIDVIYYSFAAKRTTHELFTTKEDLGNFGFVEIAPYWWLLLIWLATSYLFYRLINKLARREVERVRLLGLFPKRAWLVPFFMAVLIFVGIRGGLQLRPLRPANAFTSSSFFLGNVSLNTGYTVISSIDIGKERLVDFMPQDEAVAIAQADFKNDFDGPYVSKDYPLVRRATFDGPESHLNVVMLIIESFNASKVGTILGQGPAETLTPNFDTLARHGLLFTNFYSNGSRSVESLPALLNSMPDIFKRPVIGSSFETNAQWGIGKMLDARGYHTSFFCGGENGTMGFDSYSRMAGIQNYYGKDEFQGELDANHSKWGVHDIPFLNWIAEMQGSFKEPFFSTWFSITNHFPFDQPTDCPAHIRDRKLKPNDMTIMYTDHALGQYFQKARTMPWFKNTVFILTGDHCFYGGDEPSRAMMSNFRIPLLLIAPGIAPGREQRLGSHLNVQPTLIELLKLDTYHTSAGVSLFSKQNTPIGLNNLMGVVTLSRDTISYSTNFERTQPCFSGQGGDWKRAEYLESGAADAEWLHRLQALYQVCNNVRVDNRLVAKEWMK